MSKPKWKKKKKEEEEEEERKEKKRCIMSLSENRSVDETPQQRVQGGCRQRTMAIPQNENW